MVNGEALPVNDATESEVNAPDLLGVGGAKLSQAAIGRALGMSPANMTKLKKQGMPVDSVASAQAWRMERQNVAARKPAPAHVEAAAASQNAKTQPGLRHDPMAGRVGGDDFREIIRANEVNEDGSPLGEGHNKARTRLRISEANLSEMREAEERGQLIRIDAVKSALSVAMATAREALLQIPSRLAPLLAADTDPANVQNVLYGEIHQALAHLSGASERLGQPVEGVE